MKELTKAEEQVMQVIWDKEKCFVKEIVAEMPKPKPAYNTVSTIVRILEAKGFVDHEAFGKSHRYFPLLSKDAYRTFTTDKLVDGYFGGSPSRLVSHFIKDQTLDANDLEELLEIIEKAKNRL